jgi:hypothetical protein
MWKSIIETDRLKAGDVIRKEDALGGPLLLWTEYEVAALNNQELTLSFIKSSNGRPLAAHLPVFVTITYTELRQAGFRLWIEQACAGPWVDNSIKNINISKLAWCEELVVSFLGMRLKVTNPTRTTTLLLILLVIIMILMLLLNIILKLY